MSYLSIEEIKKELEGVELSEIGNSDNHISKTLADKLNEFSDVEKVEENVKLLNVFSEEEIQELK
jgi:hypothetical protein